MKSVAHALVSLFVAVVAVAIAPPPIPLPAVAAVALVVGVGIDLDHFLIARYNAGDWRAVRRCLREPRIVLFDQAAVFEEGEVDAIERLLTHLVIGGAAVGLSWLYRPYLGGLVAVTLYAHVLADAVSTARTVVVVDSDDAARTALVERGQGREQEREREQESQRAGTPEE